MSYTKLVRQYWYEKNTCKIHWTYIEVKSTYYMKFTWVIHAEVNTCLIHSKYILNTCFAIIKIYVFSMYGIKKKFQSNNMQDIH